MRKVSDELILQTAEWLAERDSNVTLATIGQKLGVSHAALYRYFKNKDELWTAVMQRWFKREILEKITLAKSYPMAKMALKDWLQQFSAYKKTLYTENSCLAQRNIQYIDNRIPSLQVVLQPAYAEINRLMDYPPGQYAKAEAILAVFTVFLLPDFKETWDYPDYKERFETFWQLIEPGL
ncbi:TetR/AcrR family transcriptional regulator [Lactobacillus sp. CBA3605]|uniref:TetR/AcrR family transcriptional regulator n=1 Tax=Lactobacillus sp. CBA3605 TaxID=2099788 RepID=UPI000CFDF7AE|nr:TetR/AcrR family transcriptional regulator [Lactobacillus sp. CBA3605]AVK61240.1 TetR/AcrR family transcriptional regulator [Lactobacillus sp. CBA3605]